MLDALISDLRFATRGLARRPGFALSCVLILATGIGSVTVMFSAFEAVVLRPLPFAEPERLVWVWGTTEGVSANSMSAMDYYDYAEQSDVFTSLAAHLVWRPGRVITGKGEPERVVTTTVSANLFATLGVAPLYGRGFTAAEEVEGGPDVVMLSYRFWRRRLGAEPGVVGSRLSIDGTAYEVVGVMPADFAYPENVELWFPMRRGGRAETGRGNRNFFLIGRLAQGVDLDEAQARMSMVASRLADSYPDANRSWGVRLVPLHERFVGSQRTAMGLLMGAVFLVLLVACANASSLMLARNAARRHELAIRMSLGASRGAVVRELLAESFVLSLLGAGAGVALALVGVRVLRSLGEAGPPRLETLAIDSTVLGFAALAALLACVLLGLVPALRSTRLDPGPHLHSGGRTTGDASSQRLRDGLVVGQLALSLVLLAGSGLLIRSLARVQNVDPGFDPHGVLTLRLQLPAHYASTQARESLLATTLEHIRALPGVSAAGAVDDMPPSGGPWNYVWPQRHPPLDQAHTPRAMRRIATDGYLESLRVPLLAGRSFGPGDRDGAPPVTVVSRTLAERLFPDEQALGQVLMLPWTAEGIPLEIVGIVEDVCDYGLDAERRPVFYLPYRQYPGNSIRLAVRGGGKPGTLLPAVRQAVWAREKDVAISNVATFDSLLMESTSGRRFQTLLLVAFASTGVLLASMGLYAVLACFVGERTREIGIRMAMGAVASDVIRQIVGRGVLMAGGGIALGLLGGLASSRLLQGLLYDTASWDPATYVSVSALLGLVAVLASAIPALRAARVDPVTALRQD